MGLDCRILRLLAEQVLLPYRPKSCVCLGRPHWFGSALETRALASEFGFSGQAVPVGYCDSFADPMLRSFGIEDLAYLDMFDESGATGTSIIHDLNQPIPAQHHGKYDLVLDNGTLEHVFNIPQALENCAKLCSIGGHIVMIAPANNNCGHGFYQFSPEFFYRAFANGFVQQRAWFLEYGIRNRNIPAGDPRFFGHRQQVITGSMVLLLGVARKQEDRNPFWASWPQQSDYLEYWRLDPNNKRAVVSATSNSLERFVVNHFPRLAHFLQGIKFSPFNPKYKLTSHHGNTI